LTNNNDLPTNVTLPPGGITLPDVLTESDLFMNLDTSLLLLPPMLNLEPEGKRPGSSLDFGSQLLPDSSIRRFTSQEPARLEDHTLIDLDLGEDDTPLGHDFSIEIGRDAPAPRPVEEDLFSEEGKMNELDLPLDLGEDEAPLDQMDLGPDTTHDNVDRVLYEDDAMDIGGENELVIPPGEDRAESRPVEDRSMRESLTPVPSPRSGALLDRDVQGEEQEEEEPIQQAQRVKRRKLMQPDLNTVIHSNQIRDQQTDRSGILKPAAFLPRDPVLLTLMAMRKNGDFVSSVMGMGRGRGWAPELRDILSFDTIRKSGELKRKRDSGVSDMDIDAAKAPALDLGDEDEVFVPPPMDEGIGLDSTVLQHSEVEFLADEADRPPSEDEGLGQLLEDYDETTLAADSGPVSLGTKHAVHLLRERFGDSPTQSPQKSVLFQNLLPEQETTKTDATKMFFEVLVLATKDAIKVEQKNNVIGGPLRIRGRRALWGSWAEKDAGGEIACQQPAQADAEQTV
jgi:cohesin complex subunit SCC1